MKYLLLIGFLFFGNTAFSQTMKVINADDMSDTDLENIDEIVDKDGWVNTSLKEKTPFVIFPTKSTF